MNFKSVLYLDDVRVPLVPGIVLVRNYGEFVDYLQTHEMPELCSFDHDLALEHLPYIEDENLRFTDGIPYGSYKEKTGLACARYIVENNLPLQFWAIHSSNPVGGDNIRQELEVYRPQGEVFGLKIPYRMTEEEVYGGQVYEGWRISAL